MSTGYESGTPQWDITMILTRHKTLPLNQEPCARVAALRLNAGKAIAAERLEFALKVACTCGAGDSPGEHTSILPQYCSVEARDKQLLHG